MGKRKRHIENKKHKMDRLKHLCFRHFGKHFEYWSWVVDDGYVDGYPKKIGSVIELPKIDINGKKCYSDPFVAYGGGESKALVQCLDNAIEWMESKFYRRD